jgi:hypothetical protein
VNPPRIFGPFCGKKRPGAFSATFQPAPQTVYGQQGAKIRVDMARGLIVFLA